MINCKECIDFLMEYMDQQLPEDQRTEFEKHLTACPPCLDFLKSYQRTVELERCCCQESVEAPPQLIQAIHAARKKGLGGGMTA